MLKFQYFKSNKLTINIILIFRLIILHMKNFLFSTSDKDKTMKPLKDALQIIKDDNTTPGYKNAVFYYMILNMYKHSLLNRLYTDKLESTH